MVIWSNKLKTTERLSKKNGWAFQKGKPFVHFCTQFGKDLLNFVFPPVCTGCNSRYEGRHLICDSCLRILEESIQISVQKERQDFQHLMAKKYFDEIVTCWEYTPLLEKLIHCFKYQRGRRLGRFLGTTAAEGVWDSLEMDQNTILTPVPLHIGRHRERSYNQSDILCRCFGSLLSLPVKNRILLRIKDTLTQTKLSADQRHHNVNDAFRTRRSTHLQGKTVILVDDVVTTGSTMNSCARCLKQAGAGRVIGLALSRPVLHQLK